MGNDRLMGSGGKKREAGKLNLRGKLQDDDVSSGPERGADTMRFLGSKSNGSVIQCALRAKDPSRLRRCSIGY